jgi:hypothetical protein
MKVRATRLGYLGHRRRRPGQVFHIDDSLFSEAWMEPADKAKAAELPANEEAAPVPKKVDDSWTVERLMAYCKDHGLKGSSGLTKAELIEAINNDELTSSEEDDVI